MHALLIMGALNVWVLEIVGMQNMSGQICGYSKVVGTQKCGYSNFVGIKMWVCKNAGTQYMWVLKNCVGKQSLWVLILWIFTNFVGTQNV